jgi:hypothetical protein
MSCLVIAVTLLGLYFSQLVLPTRRAHLRSRKTRCLKARRLMGIGDRTPPAFADTSELLIFWPPTRLPPWRITWQ